ncbi:UNVERIFIED_CONTAM: hypothetical protein Sradi_3311100 [Sesamum radiatum]|uniref:DUF4283 domain-containing protein n=1 Tax=Sesamum radiatum TaxID=300843 RepID=A0AAW2R279_SESRA
MEEVIEGGPWLFLGQPIVLQKWEPGMVLRKLKHTQVLIWIKLRHLPVELWTDEGLSTVVSGIGRPLYPDAIMRACTRLDFAYVCVLLDISSKLPKHIVIMVPQEDGHETACKVDVEYEWLAPKCNPCISVGHATKACPANKPPKPAISGLNRRDHQVAVQDLVAEFSMHESMLATIVYGVNDVGEKRELWQALVRLAEVTDVEPWLVGGDFNAVLDLSEVCGASRDIRVAMDDFQGCITQIGLTALPMKCERLTWHNCSTDHKSL